MLLKGKKAVITGGGQGIGFAIAQAFVQEGAQVALTGRSLEKLQDAQKRLGKETFVLSTDITKLSDLDQFYRQCSDKIGQLDVIVANAGLSHKTPLATATEAEFDQIISANLKGVFLTVQRALPYLSNGASIILISSLAGKEGVKNFSAYAASKAGVVSLAKSFAAELVEKNIRVNSISPGVVWTSMFEGLNLSQDALKGWTQSIPMKRFAKPDEIAQVALFLASDKSSYITATDIAVDGGVSGISPL